MENTPRKIPRVLVIGLVGLLVVLGFILVIRLTSQSVVTGQAERSDALANSNFYPATRVGLLAQLDQPLHRRVCS